MEVKKPAGDIMREWTNGARLDDLSEEGPRRGEIGERESKLLRMTLRCPPWGHNDAIKRDL